MHAPLEIEVAYQPSNTVRNEMEKLSVTHSSEEDSNDKFYEQDIS